MDASKHSGSGTSTPGGGLGESASGRPAAARHTAPSYVNQVIGDFGASKPKGKNLTEGGFDSDDAKNASFSSEIGSEEDPSRRAEMRFEGQGPQTGGHANAPLTGHATGQGGGPRKGGQSYGALNSDEEA